MCGSARLLEGQVSILAWLKGICPLDSESRCGSAPRGASGLPPLITPLPTDWCWKSTARGHGGTVGTPPSHEPNGDERYYRNVSVTIITASAIIAAETARPNARSTLTSYCIKTCMHSRNGHQSLSCEGRRPLRHRCRNLVATILRRYRKWSAALRR